MRVSVTAVNHFNFNASLGIDARDYDDTESDSADLYRILREKINDPDRGNYWHSYETENIIALVEKLGVREGSKAVDFIGYLLLLKNEAGYNYLPAEVRAACAQVLGEIGDKRGVNYLLWALQEPNEGVQMNVIIALGRIGDERAVDYLIEYLYRHDESELRNYVSAALARIGGERCINSLTRMLSYKNKYLVYTAFHTLSKIKNVNLTRVLALMLSHPGLEIKLFAARELMYRGDRLSLDACLILIQSGDTDGKILAIDRLAEIKQEKCLPALCLAQKDDSEYVRLKAVEALHKIGTEQTRDLLAASFFDKSVQVKSKVLDLYTEKKDEKTFKLITLSLKESEILMIRLKGIDYLAGFPGKRAEDLLWEMVSDRDFSVKTAAALKFLGKNLQDPEKLNVLLKFDNSAVRLSALKNFAQGLPNYVLNNKILFGLCFLLSDESPEIRLAVVPILERVALQSNSKVQNQILSVFKDRLGIGLFNPQEEKDPQVLEAMRKAYNQIKVSLKGVK